MRHHRQRQTKHSRRTGSPAIVSLRTWFRVVLLATAGLVLWQIVCERQQQNGIGGSSSAVFAQEKDAADKAAEKAAEQPDAPPAEKPADQTGAAAYRFDIPLPITGLVDQQVESSVERALRKLPKEGPRPVFIFEFRPKSGTA